MTKKRLSEEKEVNADNSRKKMRKSSEENSCTREFRTQCRPKGLVELIQKFSEAQKEAIRSIGFGGLLDLSLTFVPTTMMKWLMENFNGKSQMFTVDSKRSFIVTPFDVEDVLLLPRKEDCPVLEFSDDKSDIIKEIKNEFMIDKHSKLTTLQEILQGLQDGGDNFKRLFVLYSLTSFLTPSANRVIDFKPLKSLVDVDKISSFDWCTYVLNRLCKAVHAYNTCSCRKNVSGCVLILQILYLHRLKWKGIAEPCNLPLIKHWTDEKIRNRIKDETSAGVYGQGEWADVYPISSKGQIESVDKAKEKEHLGQGESKEKEHPSIGWKDHSQESLEEENTRFIKFELPNGELDDSQIHSIAKDDIHEASLLMKRDMAVIANVHMKRLEKLKKRFQKKEVASSSPQPAEVSNSQDFFSDEKVLNYIDDVVANVMKMKKLADDMPRFDLLTPETVKEKENVGQEKYVEDDIYDVMQITEVVASIGSKRKKHVEQEDEVSLDCWKIGMEAGYITRFMQNNSKALSNLSEKEKEIVDYCFFHDEKMSKDDPIFYVRGVSHISKEEIESLNSSQWIFNSIIEAWSYLLNLTEAVENQFRRFYFDLGHVQKQIKLFLEECGLPQKALDIVQYEFEIVPFAWKTNRSNIDCGVYVMNYMENFKGTVYSSPDLSKGIVRRVLRAEICTTIVTSDENTLRSDVLEKVKQFCMKKPFLKKK